MIRSGFGKISLPEIGLPLSRQVAHPLELIFLLYISMLSLISQLINEQGKRMSIILTSQGLHNNRVMETIKSSFPDVHKIKVAIITTAADEKERNKFNKQDRNLFLSAGFKEVEFIDLEFEDGLLLDECSVFYVCGGNTFKLLNYAKYRNFRKAIHKMLQRGGVYVGVSAGSIIIGPSIRVTAKFDAKPEDSGDYVGLAVIPEIVFPHYKIDQENDLVRYEAETGETLLRLQNDQFAVIHNDKTIIKE